MSDTYITIASSTRHLVKKFMLTGQERTRKRAQAITDLTGGGLHIASGRKRLHFNLTLVMPYESSDPEIGTLADLEQFFSYTCPTAEPSDRLFVTLYDGVERVCRLLGDMPDMPEGALLDTAGALYSVPVELVDVTKPKVAFNTAAGSMYVPVVL